MPTQYTADNRKCVAYDKDPEGRHFLAVFAPEEVYISVTADGSVAVSVNDSAILTISKAKRITFGGTSKRQDS